MSYGQGADQMGEMDWPGQDSPAAQGRFQRAPRQGGRRSRPPAREREDGEAGPGDDYIEVKTRILEFYAKYPDGRIQTEVLVDMSQVEVEHDPVTKWRGSGDDRKQVTIMKPRAMGVITVQARVYRTPEDPVPCIGHSYLLMPGQTPYTEGSELENAETSAVGRALAMAGIAVNKGIASGNEIRTKGASVEDELAADEAYRAWEAEQAKKQAAATGDQQAAAPQAAAPEPTAPLESKHVPPGERGQPPAAAAPAPLPTDPVQLTALVVEAVVKEATEEPVADPETGEVLEGAEAQAATTPDQTGGLTANDLANQMRAAGIGSVAVIAVAKEMFGHSNIRSLTDQDRGKLWAACVARHSSGAATQ